MVDALAETITGTGLDHTGNLRRYRAVRRVTRFEGLALDEIYDVGEAGRLLVGTANPRFQTFWGQASAESFHTRSAAEQAAHA